MRKQITKDNQRALIVKKLAEKHGVSQGYAWMVTNGTRENQAILDDYMEMKEKIDDLFENDLLDAVNKVSPFNKNQNNR